MNKTFVVSDESVNSYGYTILTAGIDLSRFEKNPIMLLQHDSKNIIGKWENVRIEDNKLLADAVFDTESELGLDVSRKVEQGFLKATSLGVTFKKDDLDSKNILSKCVLHEISIVSIGSNENALKLYNDDLEFISLAFGGITDKKELGKLLNLAEPTQTNILQATKLLLKQNIDLLSFQKSINDDREKEALEIVEFAIERKVLSENLKDLQLLQFKSDFETSKQNLMKEISNSFPMKQNYLFAQIKLSQDKIKKSNQEQESGKLKSEWDLEDYRRFAPEELNTNPDLLKELAEQYFKNK